MTGSILSRWCWISNSDFPAYVIFCPFSHLLSPFLPFIYICDSCWNRNMCCIYVFTWPVLIPFIRKTNFVPLCCCGFSAKDVLTIHVAIFFWVLFFLVCSFANYRPAWLLLLYTKSWGWSMTALQLVFGISLLISIKWLAGIWIGFTLNLQIKCEIDWNLDKIEFSWNWKIVVVWFLSSDFLVFFM